ncbi:MAG: FAD-binding protein, partial [Candidatus Liptonbacteria bacterium]
MWVFFGMQIVRSSSIPKAMAPLKENISLSRYASYKMGGLARYFSTPKSVAELKSAIKQAVRLKQKIFVLGGGTNLLISETGFDGVVIKLSLESIKLLGGKNGEKIEVGAGVLVSDLTKFAARHELSGLEWAGGLPGTVGGAIRG